MAGCRIHSAFVGVAGNHIRSLNSHGIVAIRDREVSSADLERVLDAAQAVAIPADQRVLHTLPQDYVIDNQEGVREPLGMSGVRLEAKVHVVTCAVNAAQNIEKCVRRCGLEIDDIILEQLASAYSVLTDDEKELGVCLVDIGGGTTDMAIFTEGAIRHTAVIPIAGDQVTNDIAMALRTPTQYAEEIKIRYACALAKLAGAGETIKVPSVGDRPPRELSRQALAEVVEPRYDELFTLIQAELRRSGYEDLIPAASCSLAALRRWKARWNWPRKFSTCRFAWACPTVSRACPTWCATRSIPPVSACCCTGCRNSPTASRFPASAAATATAATSPRRHCSIASRAGCRATSKDLPQHRFKAVGSRRKTREMKGEGKCSNS